MRCLLFIIFFASYNILIGQGMVYNDSSKIAVRSFNAAELQEFKNDRDFRYNLSAEPSQSLWDKFWDWIWWKISEIMRTKRGRATVWTLLVAAGIAAITFFVVKVVGMNNGGLFSRDAKGTMPYTTGTEDINRISFDEAIKEAVNAGNFRMATRLLYLQCLKKLADKDYIQWHLNKTNSDYIKEVSGHSWQSLFKKLTYSFEYTWYGEMTLASDDFKNLQAQFQQFNNQL